jgi:multidrug efflux system outer membrane protein
VKPRAFLLFMALFISVTFPGCMKMGPDFTKPDMDSQVRASYQHVVSGDDTGQSFDRWWTAFNDPELDALVEGVRSGNLDIKKALTAVSEIQSYFVQSRADRFPTLHLKGTAARQRSTYLGRGDEADAYTFSLPASFEIDLWGRLARAEEAALATLLKTEENARTIAQTIISEAITVYFQIESLERRIQITKQSIESYRRNLSFVERRYEGGVASILDLRQARRALAQAEASLPSLRQELGIRQQNLAVLSGQYPETRSARAQPEDYFRLPAPVPAGLPSDLLLRRPDIRAAEATLRALNAKIGVATASRFPTITLTGTFGYSSSELDQLFVRGSNVWNITFGALSPLFNAGKLKAGQHATEAQFQQGMADYAKTVLSAFSEVESSLLIRKEQIEKREKMMTFVAEARATQRVAENRYERGLVGYLTVLDAQQARFQAEENLVLVELAILSNRVTLHRALGGGWGDPGSRKFGARNE